MNHVLPVALTLWTLLLSPMAQLAPAQVRPEQSNYEVGPVQETTLVIMLENAAGVYGIDVRATYDPALIEVIDADPARDGIQVQPGPFPQPDFVALQDADPQTGTVRYVVTQTNPTPPANGNGVIFSLRVRGRGVAGAGEIRIDNVEMSSRDGELLPVQWASATIVTTAGGAAETDLDPTGVALIAATAEQPAAATATSNGSNAAASATAPPQPTVTEAANTTIGPTAESLATLTPATSSTQSTPTAALASNDIVPVATTAAVTEPEAASSQPEPVVDAGSTVATADTPVPDDLAGSNGQADSLGKSTVVSEIAPIEPAVIGADQPGAVPLPNDTIDESNAGNFQVWPILLAFAVVAVLVVVLLARRST